MQKVKNYILLRGENMATINNTLNLNDQKNLASLKGLTLKAFEGYFLFDNPDLYTDVLRLKFEDKSICITCKYATMRFADSDISGEEFATFGISREDEEIWLPSGTKLTKSRVNETVEGVFIVNDEIYIHDGGEELTVSCLQAIVFKLPKLYLVFQKESWLSEMIRVTSGTVLAPQLKNTLNDWGYEDEDGTCRVTRTIIKLGEVEEIVSKEDLVEE